MSLECKTTLPHSRGAVICDACFSTVGQGLMYRRDTWKDGTYHWSIRYCPDCWLILDAVARHHPCEYAGPDAEDFERWAADNLEGPGRHAAEKWLLRAYPL